MESSPRARTPACSHRTSTSTTPVDLLVEFQLWLETEEQHLQQHGKGKQHTLRVASAPGPVSSPLEGDTAKCLERED
eukprot:CAMPEP_0181200052 /NCGR_PEP_ID=MMETSP1096-20121128/17536_1 /TAXON_ID=156174 ORGANISM="Chrysochromulina ericina, Strain CCMP281" /NCGR_SAMPLE_ID=MMETSP1096 /ASSEMBLY_ACC=CAM_ASM_000453 /LENGTH=76 /DNA_ID=CAMNT_0023290339 /DNA_START=218 /DNA_END=449 /DNA_ORIENTATION=+